MRCRYSLSLPTRPLLDEHLRASSGNRRAIFSQASRQTRPTMTINTFIRTAAIAFFASLLSSPAVAQDKLRLAGGLAGTWENSVSELGQNAGFFKKYGLLLEVYYTQGAGETQQAVIAGSAILPRSPAKL